MNLKKKKKKGNKGGVRNKGLLWWSVRWSSIPGEGAKIPHALWQKKRESRSPIVYQLSYEGSPVTNSVKTLKKKSEK